MPAPCEDSSLPGPHRLGRPKAKTVRFAFAPPKVEYVPAGGTDDDEWDRSIYDTSTDPTTCEEDDESYQDEEHQLPDDLPDKPDSGSKPHDKLDDMIRSTFGSGAWDEDEEDD